MMMVMMMMMMIMGHDYKRGTVWGVQLEGMGERRDTGDEEDPSMLHIRI
jgi:hypothetical protein